MLSLRCSRFFSPKLLLMNKGIVGSSFTTFKTAIPKSERTNSNHHSERNIKKDYLHQKRKTHSSTLWLDRQLRDPYYIRVS